MTVRGGDSQVCSQVQKAIVDRLSGSSEFEGCQVTVNLRSSSLQGLIIVALTRVHDLPLTEEQIDHFRTIIVSDDVKMPIQGIVRNSLGWAPVRFQACARVSTRCKSYLWQIMPHWNVGAKAQVQAR